MTPREARTREEVLALKPKHYIESEQGVYRFLVTEDRVIFSVPEEGEVPGSRFVIDRRNFDRFIDWYNTGKFKKPRKRKDGVG